MSQMTAPTPALSPQPQNEASDLGGRRLERQLFVALLGGTLLLVSGVAHLLGASSAVADIPAAIGAALLLVPLLPGAIREMKRGEPSSDALATLAVIAAADENIEWAGDSLTLSVPAGRAGEGHPGGRGWR